MADLESIRLSEEFFARQPETLPAVRAFLAGILERWPDAEILVQKSQVTLRCPRPFCALSSHVRFPRQQVPDPHYVTLSLYLSRPLAEQRGGTSVEPYPGRFTNHLPLFSPADLDEEMWSWVEEALVFRNRK